ncbi:MAG: alpha/beta hydrolase-fold protein [Pseudomonadota bacterium]
MIKLRVVNSLFLFLVFSPMLLGKEVNTVKKYDLPDTQRVSLASSSGIPYELIISLPSSYNDSPGKRYPVLYYTDAYWDAPLLSSIYLDLVFDRAVPEFIMVGLSYSGDNLNYTALRTKDLTPTKDLAFVRDSGGGAAFLSFIKKTVVPKIEREYRTEENQRAIAGWSFGGLFALYAMYKEPHLFNRCVAISPAVPWDKGMIHQIDDNFFKLNKEFNARLFISYGKNEDPSFISAVSDFQHKVGNRKGSNLKVMNFSVENMGHAGAKASSYAQGLTWAWKDIKVN